MEPERQVLADALLESGAVKIDPENGFRLTSGATSPFYFDLRTPEHPDLKKRGPVTPEVMELIGAELARSAKALVAKGELAFDTVAGIPDGATPIAAAFHAAWTRDVAQPACLMKLDKLPAMNGRKRFAVADQSLLRPDLQPILIDDVITDGASKLGAFDPFRPTGVYVRHVFVVIDREQGGREAIERMGATLHEIFLARDLFRHYHDNRGMKEAGVVLEYLG